MTVNELAASAKEEALKAAICEAERLSTLAPIMVLEEKLTEGWYRFFNICNHGTWGGCKEEYQALLEVFHHNAFETKNVQSLAIEIWNKWSEECGENSYPKIHH